jgi:hypothetical protein
VPAVHEVDVARGLVLTKEWGALPRLFQAYSEAEGGTVEVFRNMSDAEVWLGLGTKGSQ